MLLLLMAAAVISWAGRGLTFRADDWSLLTRLDWDADAFLEPHNEHVLAFPTLFFKPLLATAGLDHYWPYLVPLLVAHLICVTLVFALARQRLGGVLASAITLPLLFFGTAWEVLLWAISLGTVSSTAAGVGILLLTSRPGRVRDLGSSGLLLVALASSSIGVSVAGGTLVEILWRKDRWSRIWIAVIPLVLYGVWDLTYNLHPHRQGPLEYSAVPSYVFRTAAGTVGGYLGLPLGQETAGAGYHAPLVVAVGLLTVALMGIVGWLIVRRGRVTGRVAMICVTLGSYWILLGVTRAYNDAPYSSRYLYPAAVFLVLLVVELLPEVRPSPRVLAVVGAASLLACGLNLGWLAKSARDLREDSHVVSAELGALEIERDQVSPDLRPDPERAAPLTAGVYFEATERLKGSPATSPTDAPGGRERIAADSMMVRAGVVHVAAFAGQVRKEVETERKAHPMTIWAYEPASGVARRVGRCLTVEPAGSDVARVGLRLPNQGLIVATRPGDDVRVLLRRFSPGFTIGSPAVRIDRASFIDAALGRSSLPWVVQVHARRRLRLC